MSAQNVIQDVAGVATALGVPAAVVAGLVAVRSLRTQAKSQRLEAILTTNDQWQDVSKATSGPIRLSADTIIGIRRAYSDLKCAPAVSVTATGVTAKAFELRVPFIVGALFPMGNSLRDGAPNDERTYLSATYARTLAFGYMRTVLATERLSPWMSEATRVEINKELDALDEAMATWVGRMNEIAELYEDNLVDRRLFVRKRSVALIQQLFAAEPYILWRNSTTPGRWGLRVLGIGAEARFYHWQSHLQNAAIRLRVDPDGYGKQASYQGFSEALGWIIGPGLSAKNSRDRRRSERIIRRKLGSGFSDASKQLQNVVIKSLPTNPESGLPAGPFDWIQTSDPGDSVGVRHAITTLRGEA